VKRKRLIESIDCTADYPPQKFFSSGDVKVVEGTAGRYREAEAKPLSRFGYRFQVEQVGKPHAVLIRFPDDKQRFMCINDGTTYDLTTGVFTDWAQPLSGQMLEMEQVFWPRWRDCSIVFMTWGEGEPAAAARLEIWELEDLPALVVPGDTATGGRRELGIQYEDPCGIGSSEGAARRSEWLDRVIEYSRHTGQKLFAYPMAWYHGPLFPSEHEPAGALEMVTAMDRKQYLRWTTQPEDWYAKMLERFEKEGLEFQGALTLMRLGSLMSGMNIDLDSIKAGAETHNNMLWNNHVQEGTRDWTTLYNVRNFNEINKLLDSKPFLEPYSNVLSEMAYGEKSNPAYHTGPMFNPLHPAVQKAILGFVREIGDRYGRYAAFKGISFNMFASSMPWFGSIHSGYDDTSIRLFEEETEIEVPSDPNDPERFSARYEFLTSVCQPAWVAWRCRKIRELFGEIHRSLTASRPDLRVTVTLWDETVIPNTLGAVSASHQLYARHSNLELFREAGIDIALYGDLPGLEIDLATGNPRDRGGHGSNPAAGANAPLEAASMFRDFDFLDDETLAAAGSLPRPGAFIFNCWVEAWGKHIWFRTEAGDANLPEVSLMDGKPAEGVLRINSKYPEDGFWWDSQLRITPPFPAGPHFLEPYAHALAELDACRITRGGLFLDKAHSEAIRGFARAYTSLPNEKFTLVGATTDPVAIRMLEREGRWYFYAVSRDYYPIQLELRFNADPGAVEDLATGEVLHPSAVWRLELGPYQLRSFAASPLVEIGGFTATAPPMIVQALTEEAQKAFADFDRVNKLGKSIPGMDKMEARMRSALAEGRLAWLRRALSSYIVRKCREICAS
jgi:hypothetical protein